MFVVIDISIPVLRLHKLKTVGLEWANSLVLRRTHSTLMRGMNVDAKLVAETSKAMQSM